MKKNIWFDKIIIYSFSIILISQVFLLSNISIENENINSLIVSVNRLLQIFLIIIGLLKNKSMKEWFLSVFCLGLSFFIFIRTNSIIPIEIVSLIFAFKSMNPKPIIKAFIISTLTSVSVLIILNLLGVIPSTIMIRASTGSIRDSLGFIHPNTLANLLVSATTAIIILYFDKVRWYHYTLISISIGVSYLILDNRTTVFIFILQLLILRLSKINRRLLNKILLAANLICFTGINIFSVLMMVIYNNSNSTIQALNNLFSGRLFFLSEYYRRYGVTLFGSNIEFGESLALEYGFSFSYFGIDNAYGRILINYGAIFYILISLIIIHVIFKYYKYGAIQIGVALLLNFILLFSENFLINNFHFFLPLVLSLTDVKGFNLNENTSEQRKMRKVILFSSN